MIPDFLYNCFITLSFEPSITTSGSLSVVGFASPLLRGEQRAGLRRAVHAVAHCVCQLVVLPMFSVS